jgi:hypothetical protein
MVKDYFKCYKEYQFLFYGLRSSATIQLRSGREGSFYSAGLSSVHKKNLSLLASSPIFFALYLNFLFYSFKILVILNSIYIAFIFCKYITLIILLCNLPIFILNH